MTSESVPLGSEITSCGGDTNAGDNHPQPFEIKDSAGNAFLADCKFVGDAYAETADSGPSVLAGKVICNNFENFYCERPKNSGKTTCGGKSVDECGKLGVNCPDKYYQLLATCRF